MKPFLYVMLLGCLLSCNQESRKILTELPNEIDSFQDSNDPTEGEKVAKALSEITPLTEDVLRNLFPKQMKGLSKDESIVVVGQQVMGSFGDMKFSLSIADAAGVYNQLATHIIDSYEFDDAQETDIFKVIKEERNGIKTTTDYYKKTGEIEMRFMYDKRFYITWDIHDNSSQMTPDQLWEAFDISALEPFKKY